MINRHYCTLLHQYHLSCTIGYVPKKIFFVYYCKMFRTKLLSRIIKFKSEWQRYSDTIFTVTYSIKLINYDFVEGKTLQSRVTLETLSLAVTLGFFFCAVSQTLGSYLSISPMLLVSVLAVLAATLFPKTVGKVSASGGVIGVLIMQVMDIVLCGVFSCVVLCCDILCGPPSLFIISFFVLYFLLSVSPSHSCKYFFYPSFSYLI